MFTAADRIRDTSTTTGTGTLTLSGTAVTKYRAFIDALSANDHCVYQVINQAATEWEVGVGKLLTSTTLSRVGVIASSNSGSAVNFGAGTKDVFLSNSGMTDSMFHTFYGSGEGGDVTISSGTTTLSADAHYKNLTISGTGSLVTNGWRVFVSEVLDLTAAPANAICWNGNNGTSVSGTTGPVGPSALTSQTVGGAMAGVNGVNGGGSNGSNGGNGTTTASANGGVGGSGGTGGDGSSGTGGTGGTGGTITASMRVVWPTHWLVRNPSLTTLGLLFGGTGGGSGGGGGGSGISGGGTGAPATGAGTVFVAARVINRGGSTAVGAISAVGGTGGSSGGGLSGTRGGGGGSGGGGGGWVYLIYQAKIGSTATGMLRANGGAGGNGGNQGAGGAPSTAGYSGGGGQAGRVTIIDMGAGQHSETMGTSPVAPVAPSGANGGVGPAGEVNEVNF